MRTQTRNKHCSEPRDSTKRKKLTGVLSFISETLQKISYRVSRSIPLRELCSKWPRSPSYKAIRRKFRQYLRWKKSFPSRVWVGTDNLMAKASLNEIHPHHSCSSRGNQGYQLFAKFLEIMHQVLDQLFGKIFVYCNIERPWCRFS